MPINVDQLNRTVSRISQSEEGEMAPRTIKTLRSAQRALLTALVLQHQGNEATALIVAAHHDLRDAYLAAGIATDKAMGDALVDKFVDCVQTAARNAQQLPSAAPKRGGIDGLGGGMLDAEGQRQLDEINRRGSKSSPER